MKIADPWASAVEGNLIAVDLENLRQGEEQGGLHWLGLFGEGFECLGMPAIDLAERRLEQFLALGIVHGRNNETLAIGGNFEAIVRLDVEEIQDWLVDHKREAVSVRSEFLKHGYSEIRYINVITM